MRRYLAAALAVTAVALFLVACSDSSDGGSSSNGTPDGNTNSEVTPEVPFSEACQKSGEKSFAQAPPRIIDTAKKYVATIETNKGNIVVELDNGPAVTTNNFVFLACKGYYDGLVFHRVEADFVIQGGDPTGTGGGGPGYTIPGEFGGEKFVTGVIGMARTTDPNSAGSQFFIMLGAAPSLDGQYASFGHVTDGMDVVQQIVIGDTMTTISIAEA
jgi:peptidyl-prolyl cis-trans isomerase B (cyclophilin B)